MDLEFWTATKVLLFVSAIITLTTQDAAVASYPKNETDRLALLNIKLRISDDPQGVLKSWNDSHHHCYWEGVICDVRHQRVTSLALRGKNLLGSISPYIGNLSFLKSIHLGENRFRGEIPQEIGHLFRLTNLNLSSNTLSGEIPVNLSQCSELRFIRISQNRLGGKIPMELGSLKQLMSLNLLQNNLTKEIPSSFGNLSSLVNLTLADNNMEGSLPNEIGSLRNLWALSLHANNFSGVIPPSIYNISTLSAISLTQNFLEGRLPNDIGLMMPNLQLFFIGGNQFYGNIPVSITNATNLEVLDLAMNKFKAQVPTNLGRLLKLRWLNLGGNLLGGNDTGDLHFITSLTNCSRLQRLGFESNFFGGELPNNIGNLSLQVREISIASNSISGTIPISLMRLTNLYALYMENNFFTGTIPRDLDKLQSLQVLSLGKNMLIGEVPSILCNLTSLYRLLLQGNNLEGTLPLCLGNCQSLKTLDISQNKLSGIILPAIFGNSFAPTDLNLSYNLFSGSLPPEVGRLVNIIRFDISYNNFLGEIPGSLGNCLNLQYLGMQCNFFQGKIPPKLASLKAIVHLDLSQNNLTGQIPKDLESLLSVNYLNLSFNHLDGEVPRNGVFSNSSQIMLVENFKLCGGIPELRLPSCSFHKKKNWKLLIITIVSPLFSLILISTTLLYYYRKRYLENGSSPMPSGEDKFLRISYHELQRATGGFSQEHIIGSGNFGVVYKGQLDQQNGKLVAVKVLDPQKNGVSNGFNAECDALRNTRHRNLVSIISYCSSIDSKGHEFKALVYKFMENGSLDMWLHPKTSGRTRLRNLNLFQRLNIAIDIASALQYLHNHCEFIIAHCDLKPSNILLNNDLTAHVGDFGQAKLLPKTTKSSSGNGTSSSVAIKGTIGYAAPEYAMGCGASTQGDVYSYGILLLEMFTGKRPTDESFTHDLNLHNYVKKNLERVVEILDPLLTSRQGEKNQLPKSNDVIIELEKSKGSIANLWGGKDYEMKCVISILRIGLKCSETLPNDRMDMNEVTRQLSISRDAFLREVKLEQLTTHGWSKAISSSLENENIN